ncbi:MAG: hypothetical protein NZ518_09465, partial [Dehalococcoidia bacterium]|nr:hypothetical protein [Dehalococcoidia bacterium]
LPSAPLADERPFARALLQGQPTRHAEGDLIQMDATMAAEIDALPDGLILMDSFATFPLILQTSNPRRFVISSDRDFKQILENPIGQVRYILAPRSTGYGAADAVNRRYPRLYDGGEPWATLEREFRDGAFRLYRVG